MHPKDFEFSSMATGNLFPELSWICALLFLLVVIMLLATCVCFKEHEKPQEYGTAGRLSITRDSPILQIQPRNRGSLSISSRHSDLSSDDGIPKRNSWTVKDRALPEIPDSNISSISHTSVTDNGSVINGIPLINTHVKNKSHKAAAPKPPCNDPSKVFPLNGTALLPSNGPSGVTVTITVNDKTHIIGSNVSTLEMGTKSRIPVADSIPGTSNSMVILKKVEKVESADSPAKQSSGPSSNLYDSVSDNISDRGSQATSVSSSPVCIKIENVTPIEEDVPLPLSCPSASLAVAGAVPSSDIPYMTPPLLHNPPSTSNTHPRNENTTSSNELPYNVISVREPLAHVRGITLKKQRATVQQNSEESEDHYAMVKEEEQMYAEIGSGQDSGSSSITYAHIEPRELPPVPPTVESLKSVAHAHSRQASTVSTSSFGSNVSSGEPASPPTLRNPSTSLYSTVEKNNKQRKTIHVAEGVSLVSTIEKRKKVEDLYAKVRKKRVELTISTSDDYSAYQGINGEDTECITPPPSPWASTTPPAPPPIAGRIQVASLLPGTSQHMRRHSADPNLPEVVNENRVFSNSARSSVSISSKNVSEPDYERIYNEGNNSGDSCYEKIKDEISVLEVKSDIGYETVDHPDRAQSDSHYPGYESVKDINEDEDSLDPGYEYVTQSNSENDPGYEPVRVSTNFDDSDSNSDYTVVKLEEIPEPNYEIVKNLARSGSDAADPGYEKIKKVPRTESNATDPGYEKVRNKIDDVADPGYETVQRSDSDTDPGYEIVHQTRTTNSRYSGKSVVSLNQKAGVGSNSNSTVLFVSGNSKSHLSSNPSSSQNHDSSSSNEATATFL
ncbi:uncharacterized protein LOC129219940 [Uloborus diversus]|uniref:uncharacterized protein LOC129219940 n=1 Tax=Uloborus diversus TaxID=327109 RepID=UPI0024098B19|nr:uncharacterized protein LOC129219940 [Uloborus diversus]